MRIKVILLSCFHIKFESFCFILFYESSVSVKFAEFILSKRISLICGCRIALKCILKTDGSAFSELISDAEVVLGDFMTFIGSYFIPFKRFSQILFNSIAISVSISHFECRIKVILISSF